ncbi:MAG: histidine-type phosphatase, partial [Legionella sp.]
PFVTLPTVNYEWKEGLGQLTAEGMNQEYKMGMQFRQKYIEQTHLLPESYEPGTVYVRSTDYDRTLMSAQSLLIGLYPPGTGPNTSEPPTSALPHAFQPIPVFSAPRQVDDVIVQDLSPKEHQELMEQYVYSTKEWQQKNEELKDKYSRWSNLSGLPINNLVDLLKLGDTLIVYRAHNAPMPSGLSEEDIQTIIEANDWALAAQDRPQQVGIAYDSKLMLHISEYLKNGIKPNSKLKYVLLSAHDTTLSRTLSFLAAPLNNAPGYASNVNFSLYETSSSSYIVKVTYNGKPVVIPACGGSSCELQQFIKLVKNTSKMPQPAG